MADPQIMIYTDGACDPNPGPGGWAAILRYGNREKVISGSDPDTTNNRMELQAALSALQALNRSCRLTLYTDSEYLRRGITQWLPAWQRAGWRTSDRNAVRNRDLWQALAAEVQRHQVDWRWVRGHAGHPLNERVDRLARSAIPRGDSNAALGAAAPASGTLQLFTRASCLGGSGPGGWAVLLRKGDEVRSRSGSVPTATANEMELLAAIQGLRLLTQPSKVQMFTVSQYLHQGVTQWVTAWKTRGWKTKEGKPVRHKPLWLALQEAMDRHEVEWHILRGGDRPPESEQAAVLANQAARALQETSAQDEE